VLTVEIVGRLLLSVNQLQSTISRVMVAWPAAIRR